MAINNAQYLVTRDIALRTGELQNHYRTADGRFILDSRALQLIRFTPDEYISGLQGVERITTEQAKTLIAQGGYKMGDQDNDFGTTDTAEAAETPKQEETKEEEEE